MARFSISREVSAASFSQAFLRRKLLSRLAIVDQYGFSLLEMVVVLAIIGILVSLQLPNVIGNTDKAKLIAAQTKITNAITECATAKANGASERDLKPIRNPNVYDLIPSAESSPKGFKWRFTGCNYMALIPVDSDGETARNQGFPFLYAKVAPGGRIIKVADFCKPFSSLNFTDECTEWDPTNTAETNYRTGRDLGDPNWARKTPVEAEEE